MRKSLIVSMLVIVFLSFTAQQCQEKEDYIAVTYKTMVTAAITYDVAMKSVADLYSQGLVSEECKAQVIHYGTEFWKAYHMLQSHLELYARGTIDKSEIEKARAEFDTAFSNFTDYTYTMEVK